jgi:hypothetical protein
MKIKFGALVVAGSGKIGGHVAAKNRGGAYLRTKVTPLNPNTSAQAGARALLASLSTAWSGLTDDQRKSWNNAVAAFATTDIFGDLRNPSGLNLYVKLNANLSNSGQALLSVAPEKIEVPFAQISSAVYDITSGVFEFNFSGGDFNGQLITINATPSMSQGVSFVKSQFRKIGVQQVNDQLFDAFAIYNAKYGVPTAGANIVVSVAVITATGQQGVAQQIKATVVA